jgi:hypothetical protein
LASVSAVGDIHRFPDGEHLASFLGLTTSKHISGTTLFQSKHITPNARYAAVKLATHLSLRVPKYQKRYRTKQDLRGATTNHNTLSNSVQFLFLSFGLLTVGKKYIILDIVGAPRNWKLLGKGDH